MSRRLSLAGQLLALQVVIICVVLVGVTAVTVAQSTQRAQEFESRRAQAVAETLANSRGAPRRGRPGQASYIRVAAETTRINSGSASVVVARPDRTVLASAEPGELGRRYDIGDSTVLRGPRLGRGAAVRRQPAAVAMAPILTGPRRDVAGFVAVTRVYPTVVDGWRRRRPTCSPTSAWPARSASSARCWWPAG